MSIRRSLSTAMPYLLVAVAVGATLAGLRYQHARLRKEALHYWTHRMEASADAARAALQSWLGERQQDNRMVARQAAKTPTLFTAERTSSRERKEISDLVTELANERGYTGVWLIRNNGAIVIVSKDADSLPRKVRLAATEVAGSGQSQTIGPMRTDAGDQFFALIEPVVDAHAAGAHRNVGAVVIGIDPYVSLFPLVLHDLDGIETARHRLVQREGNEFVIVTPSRVPKAGPGEIRIPWSQAPLGGRMAADGADTSGAFIGLDGTPIITAARHIPETGWGIVRALESSEAYDAVEKEFRLEASFVSTLVLVAVTVAFGIRRRQNNLRRIAVAESEARYRLLAEHATDLITRQDASGRMLYVSPACKQLLGHEVAELMAASPLHFVHPDDEDVARNAHEIVFRNPLSLPVQYRLRRSDGSYAWFESTGQPVFDKTTHALLELVTVSRDISKRRAVEEEGKRLALRNALLLESAAEGIVGLDSNGAIVFLNPAGERMLGWRAAEVLGQSQHEIMHHTNTDGTPHSKDSCGLCLTSSSGRGHASQDEVFWRRDGSSFPVEYQSTPVNEAEGVVGAVVTFRDVGARRRANQELVRAKEDAEAANAAKSEFLARMSHELRTPLNSVIGFSNVLRKNKAGNLKSLDLSYLERIGSNGVQLLALINDILDLSKIEAGKVTLDLAAVEVGVLVQDTLAQLGDLRNKQGVSVDAIIPATMHTIETDPAKLRQVLINLVGNAVKFTQAGSVIVTVDADRITGRPLRIRVTDTGIGIAPDRLTAVFAAFEQADTSTTREYGGTGLGLSISRALCELLGFRLGVESVVGKGTTFTIDLAPASAQAAALAASPEPLADHVQSVMVPVGDADAPLVLVIEDDADARELLCGHVRELGYRVATAASGAEGLLLAERLHPHLITLDLMMPGMDGWELLKRLATNPELARIPVIIVSAIAGEMRHSFVGAVDWIDKPIAQALLCDAITRNIDRKPGGVLIVEDDPDARELLKRYVSDDHPAHLRVANDGASALMMLEHRLPDLIVLDLKMPYVDGFAFLDSIRFDPRLATIPVIVVTAAQLTIEQRAMLAECTIAVLEKGATLEADLARVLKHAPRGHAPAMLAV